MRKLATAALSYAAAVFAARYLLPLSLLPYGAAVLALCGLIGLAFKGNTRLRILLIGLFAALGLLWSWGHCRWVVEPWSQLDGQTASVEATAVDYAVRDDNYGSVYATLRLEGHVDVKATIVCYNGSLPALEPGDRFRASLRFRTAVPEDAFETDYYTSKGVFIRATLSETPELLGRSGWKMLYFPRVLARKLKDVVDRCFPSDTAPLIKALLTGDKADLRADTALYDAMGRAGLLHVVAVSGMHVAFLIGFVSLIAGRRRRAALLGIPLILIFIPMTGGSPSAVRAGFMQICMLFAPVLKRENDGVTSLSAVLAVLLLINPRAAGSVSLQLSFTAMAGILLVSPRIYAAGTGLFGKSRLMDYKVFAALLRFLLGSIASTFGALVFSTPLMAVYFGYVSLVSPLTNLLTLWAVSLLFIGGFAATLLGMVFQPAGAAAAWLLSWLARYVVWVVKGLAALRYAAIYTRNNLGGWWLLCTYIVFLLTYIGKGKKKAFRPILPICMSVCMLCAVIVYTLYGNSALSASGVITVLDVGQGQSIVVFAGDATILIDCGSLGSSYTASDAAVDYIRSQGRRRVDLLVLTHFHADHANGVSRLMDRLPVSVLAGPEDLGGETVNLYDTVMDAVEKHGTELLTVTEDCSISVGTAELTLYAPIGSQSVNERGVIILADFGQFEMLVTGDVDAAIERRLIQQSRLPDIELLIVGHHGSRTSTSEELLAAVTPETAVISVGADNSYGHPTGEVLARLAEWDIDVYRTDRSGNVTVRVN